MAFQYNIYSTVIYLFVDEVSTLRPCDEITSLANTSTCSEHEYRARTSLSPHAPLSPHGAHRLFMRGPPSPTPLPLSPPRQRPPKDTPIDIKMMRPCEFKSASHYDMRDDASMQAYYDQFKDLHWAADLVAFTFSGKVTQFPYRRHPLARLTFAYLRKTECYPEDFMKPREAFFSFMRKVYDITPENVVWELVLWTEWSPTYNRVGYKQHLRDGIYEIASLPLIRQFALDTGYAQKESLDDHPFITGPWICMTNNTFEIKHPPTLSEDELDYVSETESAKEEENSQPATDTPPADEKDVNVPSRPKKRVRVAMEEQRENTMTPAVKMMTSVSTPSTSKKA